MIVYANCKINIGLNILGKRSDGFHDIETVMFPIRGLYDKLELVRSCNGFHFSQNGIAVDCCDEDNLCVKAYRLMQSMYDIDGVRISLDKRIPFGAGLGGGSSDATSVIVALNELFGLSLHNNELIDIAAKLGSDTAFFVDNVPQLCCGRGEILSPITLSLNGKYIVLLKPNEGVSTGEAYAGVLPQSPQIPLVKALSLPMGTWLDNVHNDFEPHIFSSHPVIAELKNFLLANGAVYASMSGSGSTVFGIFDQEPHITAPYDNVFIHIERI